MEHAHPAEVNAAKGVTKEAMCSPTASPTVLGIDVGTSSTKGVLVDCEGAILRTAVREHEVQRPSPGYVEMDARIWWRELTSIVEELLAPGDVVVEAIGVSGMGPCVLLTDDALEPVRPAILYGIDTRAGEQVEQLTADLREEAILERCGSVLTSQSAGPKIAWIAQQEPDLYARATRLFMPSSYLVARLSGAYVLDHHSASQSTPLYDTGTLQWHEPWAQLVAPGLELPQLLWPGECAGVVTDEAAAELPGVPAGVPVIAGTIDAWTEAVSVDAQNPGDLMLMYGTTMFLVATTTQRTQSDTMWGTVGAIEGTFNYAGGMATSGAITAWIRRLTGDAPYSQLLAEASESGPGARGLLMLPYFAGERTPIQDPDARGTICGLTLDHTRGDIYRAALEATAFGVRHNIEELRRIGVHIDRVVAAGGGTQGGLWTQIVTDVTGLEQVIPTSTVGASYGASMLAAAHAPSFGTDGLRVDASRWNPPVQVLSPDPAAQELYDRLYRQYRELYPGTRSIAHTLAALQRES